MRATRFAFFSWKLRNATNRKRRGDPLEWKSTKNQRPQQCRLCGTQRSTTELRKEVLQQTHA